MEKCMDTNGTPLRLPERCMSDVAALKTFFAAGWERLFGLGIPTVENVERDESAAIANRGDHH